MNSYYISFDDTDNLEALGTGHLLEDFLNTLSCHWSFISRHQLFVSQSVPYTSHNSAMCATLTTDLSLDMLIKTASDYLTEQAAPGSDPGLCIATSTHIQHQEDLVIWGYRAKKEVLVKDDAYTLANRCHIHLSEHGGNGQGVIGALAALGLRLAGQDGRIKGKKPVSAGEMTVAQLLKETGFDCVAAYGQGRLPDDAIVTLNNEHIVKAVYQNHQRTVLTVAEDDHYRVLDKQLLKCF